MTPLARSLVLHLRRRRRRRIPTCSRSLTACSLQPGNTPTPPNNMQPPRAANHPLSRDTLLNRYVLASDLH